MVAKMLGMLEKDINEDDEVTLALASIGKRIKNRSIWTQTHLAFWHIIS